MKYILKAKKQQIVLAPKSWNGIASFDVIQVNNMVRQSCNWILYPLEFGIYIEVSTLKVVSTTSNISMYYILLISWWQFSGYINMLVKNYEIHIVLLYDCFSKAERYLPQK